MSCTTDYQLFQEYYHENEDRSLYTFFYTKRELSEFKDRYKKDKHNYYPYQSIAYNFFFPMYSSRRVECSPAIGTCNFDFNVKVNDQNELMTTYLDTVTILIGKDYIVLQTVLDTIFFKDNTTTFYDVVQATGMFQMIHKVSFTRHGFLRIIRMFN